MAFEVPHRAMLLASLVCVLAALGGCRDAELVSAPAATSTAAPTSISAASPTHVDAGSDAGGATLAPSDASPAEPDDAAIGERDPDTGPQPYAQVPDSAPTTSPTWGCVEGGGVCDCYDAHLTDRYSQPTCVEVYPCCVRFTVTRSDGDTFSGCDCYSDAYLSSVGGTCAAALARIEGIAIYSEAAVVSACPAK